jgi:hypothetical protein
MIYKEVSSTICWTWDALKNIETGTVKRIEPFFVTLRSPKKVVGIFDRKDVEIVAQLISSGEETYLRHGKASEVALAKIRETFSKFPASIQGLSLYFNDYGHLVAAHSTEDVVTVADPSKMYPYSAVTALAKSLELTVTTPRVMNPMGEVTVDLVKRLLENHSSHG